MSAENLMLGGRCIVADAESVTREALIASGMKPASADEIMAFRDKLMKQHDAQTPIGRLAEIARIIEAVDDRAMAADGPVTPTLQEMTQAEMSRIYALATPNQSEE